MMSDLGRIERRVGLGPRGGLGLSGRGCISLWGEGLREAGRGSGFVQREGEGQERERVYGQESG